MAKEEPNAFANVLSLLPKFEFKFPFFNQEPKRKELKVQENPKTAGVAGAGSGDGVGERLDVKPNLARFPNSNSSVITSPLEFEAEEPTGRTSNPVVLWQVYALGGFLVLKWALARWKEMKERKGKKESSDDNEPPAPAPAPAPMPAPDDESYRSAQNSS